MNERISRIAAGLTVLICLGFAAYTHHAWEDYFITFRTSLNLATGKGLVYQTGERIHSFTSPLGTLLPALFALGNGPEVETRALWIFRLISSIALGTGLLLTIREFSTGALARRASLTAVGLWMFDPKIVDFSINGMESALLILFLVLTWRSLIRGASLWQTATGLAGLQWTRPDGFILGGVLITAWSIFRHRSIQGAPRQHWLVIGRAAALAMALYLPWLFFAWTYYGSPIPHTIIAKNFQHPLLETALLMILYPLRLLFGHVAIHDIFMPAYFYFGGWPDGVTWFARILGIGAAIAWVHPGLQLPGRIASMALFLGGFYLEYIPGSPWYFPPWQVLGCISWAYLLGKWANHESANAKTGVRLSPARIASLSAVTIQAMLLISVAWQMRTQQALIENGHRKKIGLWLKSHATQHDRVYLEPLGYIGYYSQLKMFDNPGLASTEVVSVRKNHSAHAEIIETLRPEWLVLRPDQVGAINESSPHLLSQDYKLARVFDTQAQVDAIALLPGRGYLNFDARFLIFARTAASPIHDVR